MIMNTGNDLNLTNGLHLCIDWLSWTVTEPCFVNDVIQFMGYTPEDFRKHPTGLNGYRSQLRHLVYPISIQYDGSEDMGIHVDVSGSAITDLLSHFYKIRLKPTVFGDGFELSDFDSTIFRELFIAIKGQGHVTRLDLAVDDIGCNYYTMTELNDIFASGAFSSRFRSRNEIKKYTEDTITGNTIYLGSRKSAIMLRIYDKQLEQNGKLISSGKTPITTPWVRWEIELKKERAEFASELLSQGMPLQLLTLCTLRGYLRIINLDNERKTRCSTSEKWERFIDGVDKISLYYRGKEKTIDSTREWLARQVAPSLAMVVMADGGSMEYLTKLLVNGAGRIKEYQNQLIQQEMGSVL